MDMDVGMDTDIADKNGLPDLPSGDRTAATAMT